MDVEWEGMEKLRDLTRKYPNIVAVLDHCGFPKQRTDEYFQHWKQGMTTLAEAENVGVQKFPVWGCVTGSGRSRVFDRGCCTASRRSGPERCMFGTNWPVDKLFSTYDVLTAAYTEIVADFSKDEQVCHVLRQRRAPVRYLRRLYILVCLTPRAPSPPCREGVATAPDRGKVPGKTPHPTTGYAVPKSRGNWGWSTSPQKTYPCEGYCPHPGHLPRGEGVWISYFRGSGGERSPFSPCGPIQARLRAALVLRSSCWSRVGGALRQPA